MPLQDKYYYQAAVAGSLTADDDIRATEATEAAAAAATAATPAAAVKPVVAAVAAAAAPADHHGSPQEEIEREAGHLLVPEEGPKIREGSKEQAVF